MLRFGETKVIKEKFYAPKNLIKICDANVDNTVISKLAKIKTNSKYLIGYLDKVIRPLVLIVPIVSGYVKIIGVKDKNKDKKIKLKLLEKYKAIWTKIEDLKKN